MMKKEELKELFDEYFSDCNPERLHVLRSWSFRVPLRKNLYVYFELLHHDDDPDHIFNYTWIQVRDGKVVKDEADGELTIWQVLRRLNKLFTQKIFMCDIGEGICIFDEIGVEDYDCIDCGYCDEDD